VWWFAEGVFSERKAGPSTSLGMTIEKLFIAARVSRRVSSKFYGQATKGAWWMPWQKQAMKDVASCDKPRGAASRH
jgi:hypothetical protein